MYKKIIVVLYYLFLNEFIYKLMNIWQDRQLQSAGTTQQELVIYER